MRYVNAFYRWVNELMAHLVVSDYQKHHSVNDVICLGTLGQNLNFVEQNGYATGMHDCLVAEISRIVPTCAGLQIRFAYSYYVNLLVMKALFDRHEDEIGLN